MRLPSTIRQITTWGIIVFVVVTALAPFGWALLTSLRWDMDLLRGNPFLPASLTFENYRALLHTGFIKWLWNSLIVSTVVTLLSLTLGIPFAYFLTHRRIFPKQLIQCLFVFGFLAPSGLLFLPISRSPVISNSPELIGLILVYLSFLAPQSVWLLTGYFHTVDPRFEKITQLDGISTISYIISVLIPVCLKGICMTGVFCFIASWGEYTYALVLTHTSLNWTLPVGISSLETGDIIPWGKIMAGVMLSIIPIAIPFVIALGQVGQKLFRTQLPCV